MVARFEGDAPAGQSMPSGEGGRATMKAIKAAPRIHPAALAPTGNLRTSSFFPSFFLHLMPIGLSHYQDSEAGDRRLRSVVGICVTNSWERAAFRGIARPSAHAAANDSSPMLERAADTAFPLETLEMGGMG